MTLHDISIISMALVMASMILMAAATTPQSTNIDILFPALHDMDFNNVEGSVMSADATATFRLSLAPDSHCRSVLPGLSLRCYQLLEQHYLHCHWYFGLQHDRVHSRCLLLLLDQHMDLQWHDKRLLGIYHERLHIFGQLKI